MKGAAWDRLGLNWQRSTPIESLTHSVAILATHPGALLQDSENPVSGLRTPNSSLHYPTPALFFAFGLA